MTEHVKAGVSRAAPSRWAMSVSLGSVLAIAIVAGFAGAPYLFNVATLQSEIETQVRATTGLVISAKGGATFELLPRPHVVIADLRFTDPSGTLGIDAERLDGDVRLLPLVVGRLELSSVTLQKPRLTIDLDGRPMQPDNTIGRALHADGASQPAAERRLGTVTLVDGSAVLKSKSLKHVPSLDAINVTIDWRDLDAPATLTGSIAIQKTATEVAVWVAEPSGLMRGDHSAMTLRLHSAPADIAANGDVVSAATSSFRGHVSVSAPSLSAALALAGYAMKLPAPFANLALNSDATIGIDRDGQAAADLPSLHLRLDGNDYEGTLSLQNGPKPLLSGTLASDELVLTPFLYRAPSLVDADREWDRAPIGLDRIDPIGLDLRISATHLRLAPITIDDAALSVMTRESRTEVGLVEGKAYSGGIKGRMSFETAKGGLYLRGVGSLADVDAASLSWDLFGRQLAGGKLSGSANLETFGNSPAALMEHLQGWAKGHATDGEISGIDLGRSLRDAARNKVDATMPILSYGRTTFASLAFALRINDGIASFDDVSMQGDDSTLVLTGKTDVGNRLIDLHAYVTSPPSANIPSSLRFDITGTFDNILLERPALNAKP